MKRQICAFVSAALFAATSATAQTKDTDHESRWHWTVRTARVDQEYVATEIERPSEHDDRSVVLIRTPEGDSFAVTSESNYETHTFDYEIRDAQSPRDFLRLRLVFPVKAKTLKTFVEELKESGNSMHVSFDIRGPDGQHLSGVEPHWGEEGTARKVRPVVRRWLSDAFLQKLARVHPTGLFDSSLLAVGTNRLMEYLFVPLPGRRPDLFLTRANPDCGFDKSFGYPCSATQLQAAAGAPHSPISPLSNMY